MLVAGAAGAGKTTTLATARAVLEADGQQVLVVTPTLKAARTARRETGAAAGSAAWLAYQHGWRWDTHGAWTRLSPGQVDPATGAVYGGPVEGARLSAGDLLVVDEAGMVDQDTARALLHVADEQHARLALVGDPHQLAAIGRGGVLDLAGRWADRTVTLDVIHRFTRSTQVAPGITGTVPDEDYAALSLAMRTGEQAGQVFDQLAVGGHVQVHPDDTALLHAVATAAAGAWQAGQPAAIAAGTREQVRILNDAIRDRLVAAGLVDDQHTTSTGNGETIGAGDLIATRRNDRAADVANRDTWTVAAVYEDGTLTVTGPAGRRSLPAGYVAEHVDLAYATTVHGLQGDTAHTGHLVLSGQTGAAAAYVGMTRGRTANTVHIIAADLADARAQWVDAVGRGRADLGIAAARTAAQRAAVPYATPTQAPPAGQDPQRLAQVLDGLRAAWTEQASAAALLDRLRPRLARATADAARREQAEATLAPLYEQMTSSRAAADAAEQQATAGRALLDRRAEAVQAGLRASWDTDRPAAGEAARTVQGGPGRLGLLTGRSAQVAAARRLLDQWADKWRAVQPELTDATAAARYAVQHPGNDHIDAAIGDYTRRRVSEESPQPVQAIRAAERAAQVAAEAADTYTQAAAQARHHEAVVHAAGGWRDLAADLPRLTQQTTAAQARLDTAEQRISQLSADPAISDRDNPDGLLAAAHTSWTADHTAAQAEAAHRAQHAARQTEPAAQQRRRDADRHRGPTYRPDTGRGGPSIGR